MNGQQARKEPTMKKMTLVEMLKNEGYAEAAYENPYFDRECLILTKTYEKDVKVCWYGTMRTSLKVDVFVNLTSGICRATFFKDSSPAYKDRWYDTTGKRTFNAISETIKNAGFKI